MSNVAIGWFKSDIIKAVERETREQVQEYFQSVNKFLRVDRVKLLVAAGYVGSVLQEYSTETYEFDFSIAKAIFEGFLTFFG